MYPRVYSDKLLELFKSPKNVGEMENPDAKATEGSLVCGDMITIYLKIDKDTRKITDIKFQSYGCAANIAVTSLMTEEVKGKTLEEAKKLTFRELTEMIGGLPPTKMHCSVLAVDGLRAAIRDYEERHGLVKVPTVDESFVRSKLRHVMNPWLGRDIVSLGMLESLRIEEGVLEVTINLSRAGKFKEFIINEVNEKLSNLPNIKKVKVNVKEGE
jgi:NifU-like protein involved in Fe-S cluster formation